MRAVHALALAACAAVWGCGRSADTITAAFPRGFEADPWTLEGRVWTGPGKDAAAALGDDWARIEPFDPGRVCLAMYRHARHADRTLTIRAFELESAEDALRLLESWRGDAAAAFAIGDAGCYTEFGVMFVHRKVLFDVFGDRAGWEAQIQAAYVVGLIERRLTRGKP